jgi:hypothetical protein
MIPPLLGERAGVRADVILASMTSRLPGTAWFDAPLPTKIAEKRLI